MTKPSEALLEAMRRNDRSVFVERPSEWTGRHVLDSDEDWFEFKDSEDVFLAALISSSLVIAEATNECRHCGVAGVDLVHQDAWWFEEKDCNNERGHEPLRP